MCVMETTNHKINKGKDSSMKTFKFGVEIEVTRKNRHTVATAVQTVVARLDRLEGIPITLYAPMSRCKGRTNWKSGCT